MRAVQPLAFLYFIQPQAQQRHLGRLGQRDRLVEQHVIRIAEAFKTLSIACYVQV